MRIVRRIQCDLYGTTSGGATNRQAFKPIAGRYPVTGFPHNDFNQLHFIIVDAEYSSSSSATRINRAIKSSCSRIVDALLKRA